ncbi:MAG: molecular chaperone TorD family protein [Acidobacteriota bacterium]
MKDRTTELADVLARRELWLLVSVGFSDPYHRKRFELLKKPDFRHRVIQATALVSEGRSTIELGPGEVNPRQLSARDVFAALDSESVAIESAYRKLFGLTAVSQQCPACEVEYDANSDSTYRSQRLGDLAGFYQAFALQVSQDAAERIDHVTIEAEFLYVLLAKEGAALYHGDSQGVEVCRQARRKFFQEHVGWWLPAFSRLVSRVSTSDYYCRLAALTAGVSALERVCLGLPPSSMRALPQRSEPVVEAACFECLNQRVEE